MTCQYAASFEERARLIEQGRQFERNELRRTLGVVLARHSSDLLQFTTCLATVIWDLEKDAHEYLEDRWKGRGAVEEHKDIINFLSTHEDPEFVRAANAVKAEWHRRCLERLGHK